MARQPSSSQDNQPSRHYVSQAGLAVAVAAILRGKGPRLSRVGLYALLVRFSQASATLAAQDYTARRTAAGIRSPFTVPHAGPASPEHFAAALNWVYAPPRTAPATVTPTPAKPARPSTTPGPVLPGADTATPTARPLTEAEIEAEVQRRLEAVIERLTLQVGRETTVEAVRADSQARAWARETRGDCCYFCALMAARGAVYKSEGAAGRDANEKFTGSGLFKFHNNCHCVAVPVFGEFEKTAEARAWNRLYHDLKRDLGRAPSLLEWRNAFDGATQNVPQLAGN